MATADEIERIVREVVSQLATTAKAETAPPPVAGSGDVFLDLRLVTMESIAGRLNGAAQLRLPPGAVVTPAARDELRRKGITLIRGGGAAGANNRHARVLLVVGRSRRDPAPMVRMLARQSMDVRVESFDCMIVSTDRLAKAVATEQSLGVLWTRHTAAGLCLANRHAGVRAVLAGGIAASAAATAAVGANVLIVDPALGGDYERNQIVRDFCLGGIRECPEGLKGRLE